MGNRLLAGKLQEGTELLGDDGSTRKVLAVVHGIAQLYEIGLSVISKDQDIREI